MSSLASIATKAFIESCPMRSEAFLAVVFPLKLYTAYGVIKASHGYEEEGFLPPLFEEEIVAPIEDKMEILYLFEILPPVVWNETVELLRGSL